MRGDGDRSAPWGRKLALAALSFVLFSAFGECAVRRVWTNPYRHEQPDWVLPLAIQHAGKELPIDRRAIDPESPIVTLRTDERGYLLPSQRFEKPDATVAFLGGSTTECAALSEESRFPAQVSTLLEQHGLRVNTLNAGKSGSTSHDAVNVLFNHVVQDHPDVAVLMEAANDYGVLAVDPEYRSRSGAPMTAAGPLRWALQSLSTKSSFVGALRHWLTVREAERGEFKRPAAPEWERVSPTEFEHRLRAFIGVSRAFGIEPVLMTQPFAPIRTALTPGWTDARDQQAFNQTIRSVAQAEHVTLIDLVEHLERDVPGWDQPMKVFYDGIHITEQGARIYADYITEQLLATVLSPAARSQRLSTPSARSR